MHTSAKLALASPAVTSTHPGALRRLVIAVLNMAFDVTESARQVVRSRRRQSAWREDLPWNVGLDHLGETGYPPFVPRGN